MGNFLEKTINLLSTNVRLEISKYKTSLNVNKSSVGQLRLNFGSATY